MSRFRRVAFALLTLAVVAGACGDDPPTETATGLAEPELVASPSATATEAQPSADDGYVPDGPPAAPPADSDHTGPPVELVVEVVTSYPHDTEAFTQGLEFDPSGRLFESTGIHFDGTATSSLREVDLASGDVDRSLDIPGDLFTEGLTLVGGSVIQLTWTEERAFVYDLETFETSGTFSYEGEGWGLCRDGSRLVMSDGSDRLTFRDPASFQVQGSVSVTFDGMPIERINELECVDGQVWANIWLTDDIVRIDPATGVVNAVVRTSGLIDPHPASVASDAVLNGIAYRDDTDTFFITGKLWPTLFEVRFV